jgi:serine/threonine-protein kinase RsbW
MEPTTLELKVPSEVGNERYAIQFAEDVAQDMGFPKDKIENLKIAIGEACLNAIEHGNKQNRNVKVEIDFVIYDSHLEINVQDRGETFKRASIPTPDLAAKIEGKDPSVRGWGVFLIEHMVDKMEYVDGKPGTQLRMTVRLPDRGPAGRPEEGRR